MKKVLIFLVASTLSVTIFACPLMQAGEGGTDFSSGTAQITFSCPMPDANYTILIAANSIVPGAFSYQNKTANGFLIAGGNGSGGVHGFSWIAFHD